MTLDYMRSYLADEIASGFKLPYTLVRRFVGLWHPDEVKEKYDEAVSKYL